jgi:DNA-nicking Smr family endonuclease
MGTKDSKHSNSESNTLFRSAVGDIKPIKQRDRDQSTSGNVQPGRSGLNAELKLPAPSDTVPRAPVKAGPGDKLIFQRASVSRKIMRDLRRGRVPVDEEMDLHGMTGNEAHRALHDFIAYCTRRRLACVRIVHGKGHGSGEHGPVLKTGVNHWLRQWDDVLAFCSTPERDGGTGAIYVLLRRR